MVLLSSGLSFKASSYVRVLILIGVFVVSILQTLLPFKQRLVFGRVIWHLSLLASRSSFVIRVFVEEADAKWMR